MIWPKYSYQILDLCAAINASINGSGDPQPDEWLRDAIETLTDRLEKWEQPTLGYLRCYDDAIRLLVRASIDLARRDIAIRESYRGAVQPTQDRYGYHDFLDQVAEHER